MKKLLIFTSLSLILVGCSSEETPKTKPNPFKNETTSSQVSSQSTTMSTSTVTTTTVTLREKKADFVVGTYVTNFNGRQEWIVDEEGPIIRNLDGTKFKMSRKIIDGYLTFSIIDAPTPEMGTPIFIVPSGKEIPSEIMISNPEDNKMDKERLVVPSLGGGVVWYRE